MKEVKTLYALEVIVLENNVFQNEYFETDDQIELVKKAQNSPCDILSLRFGVKNIDDIPKAKFFLKQVLPYITKDLMISGTGNDNIDKVLLPTLIRNLDRKCIISNANENTYQEIVPEVIKGKHRLVLKTPIDINSCRELNILVSELGLPLNQIIIDTDIGGLGYGLDFGYSMVEKIRLENSKYLKMPVISFVAKESLQIKETKSNTFSKSWGDLKNRSRMFELASVSALKAAGANILVMYYPENIKTMKGLE
ncbi:hypothetical protein IJZ97_06690 [bacterium]|nr:hypothetical protein [bacterium]